MKKLTIFTVLILSIFLISCGGVQIIDQTGKTLVLQSNAATKY